jgi:hypothetical protein
MSTIPYYLRNPMDMEDDKVQNPATMAPSAPQGMTSSVVQHPMHALIAPIVGRPVAAPQDTSEIDNGIKGINAPKLPRRSAMMAPPAPDTSPEPTMMSPPAVRTMSPMERYEDHLVTKQMADYDKDANPYGSENNHPGVFGKILHGLSMVTGGPNRRLFSENQREGQIEGTEKNIGEQALQSAHTEAQKANTEYTEQKPEIEKTRLQQQNDIASSKNASVLAKAGYKQDDDGAIVPMDYDEMSPAQQSSYDLKNAQKQLAVTTMGLRDAQTDFENMRGDPNSVQNQQIAQRLQIAKQAQDRMTGMMGAMQERADAQMINAKAGAYGVGMDNQPLPGAMLTEQGQPVGSHFQTNVRPTGAQRTKGNMAESADQQINDMKSIVSKRPDVFGPAGGRVTDFNVWVGSQDPDAQRFRAARTIAGDHLAGTFGGRSEAALNALDSAIGHFKDNPKAVSAGLDQLQEANHLFLNAGRVHTVGDKQTAHGGGNAPHRPANVPAEFVYNANGSKGAGWYRPKGK